MTDAAVSGKGMDLRCRTENFQELMLDQVHKGMKDDCVDDIINKFN